MGKTRQHTEHKRVARSSVRLHRGPVTLQCVGGSATAKALVTESGKFALHPSILMDGFSVTYVPTGMSIVQGKTKAEAKKIIGVLERYEAVWNFRNWRKVPAKARQNYDAIMRGDYEDK